LQISLRIIRNHARMFERNQSSKLVKHSVYMLLMDGVPFYIGVTSNLDERFKVHKRNHGQQIQIEELECCLSKNRSNGRRHDLERFWINQFRAWGFDLKNRNANPSYNYQRRPQQRLTT